MLVLRTRAALRNPNTSFVKTETSPGFLCCSVPCRSCKWTAAPIVRETPPLGALFRLRHEAHLLGVPFSSPLSPHRAPGKGFCPTLPTRAVNSRACPCVWRSPPTAWNSQSGQCQSRGRLSCMVSRCFSYLLSLKL